MIARRFQIMFSVGTVLVMTFTAGARAQSFVSQMASARTPVLDEFGAPLSNRDRDLVQFLLVNGEVHAPSTNGAPHANNPVVFEARFGDGVVAMPAYDGRFSVSITPKPAGTIIARAYNAPSLAEASFYADSQPFTPNGPSVFVPVFGATTNAIDTGDDDQDGVHNSWEKSLGSNKNRTDSDDDGMADGDEFRSGTGLADADSYLGMVRLTPRSGGSMEASWDAVPGKRYQLQFTAFHMTATNSVFTNVNGVVTAVAETASTVMTNAGTLPMGFFRVTLVEEPAGP